MWIGLGLGLLLVLLGLSGSVLVYDDAIAGFIAPPPRARRPGTDAAAGRDHRRGAGANYRARAGAACPAAAPGEAASVRLGEMSRMGAMPGNAAAAQRDGSVLVDPVSGAVLGTRTALLPPF